jgi:N-acetylmuramoyl-L-alanine amidase
VWWVLVEVSGYCRPAAIARVREPFSPVKASLGLQAGAALLALLLGACAQLPEYTRLPVVQHPSVNFNERRPSFVILHHTGNAEAKRALGALSNPVAEVSAHYLVARDGTIYYLVDEMKRAWHAGESWWGGPIDMNSASIGIELDNDGSEPYAESQIAALLALLTDLEQRYKIPAANFLGHGDIAPGRKVDPGVGFPWRRLAEHGFGLWCEPPFKPVPPGVDDGALLEYQEVDAGKFYGVPRKEIAEQGVFAVGRAAAHLIARIEVTHHHRDAFRFEECFDLFSQVRTEIL